MPDPTPASDAEKTMTVGERIAEKMVWSGNTASTVWIRYGDRPAFSFNASQGCAAVVNELRRQIASAIDSTASSPAAGADIELVMPEDCEGTYSRRECSMPNCPTPGECFQRDDCLKPKLPGPGTSSGEEKKPDEESWNAAMKLVTDWDLEHAQSGKVEGKSADLIERVAVLIAKWRRAALFCQGVHRCLNGVCENCGLTEAQQREKP